MSLSVSFKIDDVLQKDISFREVTGQYSSINQGGYGSPNPAIAQILTSKLYISKRSTDGTFEEDFVIDFMGTGILPSNNGNNIILDNVLYTKGFSDGIYRMTYKVTGINLSSVAFESKETQYYCYLYGIKSSFAKLSLKYKSYDERIKNTYKLVGLILRDIETGHNNLDYLQIKIEELNILLNCFNYE